MLEWIYRLLALLAVPGALARHWIKGVRQPEYRERTRERLGISPTPIPTGSLWFHCVSVGETVAAAPLIEASLQRSGQVPVLVTTTTPAGSAEVRRRFGTSVHHCYAPYDATFAVRRFLRRTSPVGLVLVETELWPNLLRETTSRGIPAWLVNARLSERSAKGYRSLGVMGRNMVRALRGIASQYEDTATRLLDLGAEPSRVAVTGSTKFDVRLPVAASARNRALRQRWSGRRSCWIAASTHAAEEPILLRAHRELLGLGEHVALILAPRHAHRASGIRAACQRMGLEVRLYSQGPNPESEPDVIVVDVMGKLMDLYPLADVAFIGGSLDATGGHNPIEAAVHRLPLLTGPERRNFAEVCRRFEEAGALRLITGASELKQELRKLLNSPQQRSEMGEFAERVVERNRGAAGRTVELLQRWLEDAGIASSRQGGPPGPPKSCIG